MRKFRIPFIPYRSLLLSTTVLNDTSISNSVVCNDLDILYTNADQFLNKRDDLSMFISGNEPDIILITEVLP